MKSERWRQIDQLLEAALERSPDERAAFLAEACADDKALRMEVESLIRSHEEAGPFIEAPAIEMAAEMLADAPAESLSGRRLGPYNILQRLGMGGMGEVYLAQDQRLRRRVAIKLLPVRFTNDEDRVRRFEREAHAASALNHPNIITIYETGRVDDIYYIATEFIEGSTLRKQMAETRLKLSEALDAAIQIASALVAAHAAGIIHRDIKPENIILRPDGYIKVLDFGLVKLAERSVPQIDSQEPTLTGFDTHPGMILGTAQYMSPEQARGQEVDERSDIFSLAVVLYEMAAGRAPFVGATTSDVINTILDDKPEPLSKYLLEESRELERIVSRALCKDRKERYQVVTDLLADLKNLRQEREIERRLARPIEPKRYGWRTRAEPARRKRETSANKMGINAAATDEISTLRADIAPAMGAIIQSRTPAILLFILAVVALCLYLFGNRKAAIESVAILPFTLQGVQRDDEYLGLGMADALISKLKDSGQITVRPMQSTLKYQNSETDLNLAGQALHVDAVIGGSVQKAGNKVRVKVRLARTGEEQITWSGEVSEQADDLLALQDTLSMQVAQALELKLTDEAQQRMRKRYTEKAQVYQIYMQGRYFLNKKTLEGFNKAIKFYEQAIAQDAHYALAYADLALCWSGLAEQGGVPISEGAMKAKITVQKALDYDDSLSEAHASKAIFLLVYDWNLAEADRESRRALELDPNDPMALQWRGVYLIANGRTDEAVAVTRRGVKIDPVNLVVRSQLCRALYLGRRYDEAILESQALLQMDTNYSSAYSFLGQSYAQKEMLAEAIIALQKANSLPGSKAEMLSALGHTYGLAGKRNEALNIIAQIKSLALVTSDSYHLAVVYAGLAENEEAFSLLERAYQNREPFLINRLKTDPKLTPLSSDQRYVDLLRRIGLNSQ